MSFQGPVPTNDVVGEDTVTVIIPVYNGERFIRKALESVLQQTLPASEILVIDDGSKDSSRQIVESEFGSAVTVISQKNGGLSNARNTGLRAATGKYIAFLDVDDWWDPRKLELQVKQLQAHPEAGGNFTGLFLVSDTTGETEKRAPTDVSTLWPQLRWCNPSIAPSSVMVTREAVEKIGKFNEDLRACEDWDYWFRLVRSSGFTSCPEPLTYYLLSSGGLSGDADHMFNSFLKILDSLLLDGLVGMQRKLWRRRIISYQAYKSQLTARAAGNARLEREYMWKSFRVWPSPFWASERFKSFAVTLLRT
jgi:glycosyltransferase involved in cell wall biosynthesis